VARDRGGTSQEHVELALSHAALALFISLNEAIEDEIVERGALVRAWDVHGTLDEANVLLLRVVLHVVETDILGWDLADTACNVFLGPLNELIETEDTTSRSSLGVQAIKDLLVAHLAGQRVGGLHWGKAEAARDSCNLLEQAIELLQVDEAILVGVNITEREGKESIELTLGLAGSRGHSLVAPGLEGVLVVAPAIGAPWAGC
jgi:hypothetical protein